MKNEKFNGNMKNSESDVIKLIYNINLLYITRLGILKMLDSDRMRFKSQCYRFGNHLS